MFPTLSATDVQKLLGVKDDEIFCHGYLLDRRSLDLYFSGGSVVREVSETIRGEKRIVKKITFDKFETTKLLDEYKRVYKSNTHPKFVEFVNSFGLMAKLGVI